MHWAVVAGGIAAVSYYLWSRHTAPFHLDDDVTEIPRSMLDKYIQPQLYQEIARNYRNVVDANHPFNIRTADIPHSDLCNSDFIRTVIEDQGGIHGDYIVTKVGDGAQGTVYKMESPDEQKVLKFFRTASSSLIEANSLIGLELNGRQIVDYEFKEIMSGLLSEPKPGTFPEFQDMKVVDQKGDFCVMSSFIRGVPLINHINAMQAIAYKLKATMRLVVQLLRQIQGIHFTLNRYALTEPGDRDIFGVQSYANYHSDIHDSNILIDYYDPNDFDAVLIDYGLVFKRIVLDKDDVQIHMYNNVLRSESKLNEENKILIHRILSFGQNIDFCTIGLIMIQYFYDLDTRMVHFNVCRLYRADMMDIFKREGRQVHFMAYLRKLNNRYRRDHHLIPILQTLLNNLFRPMDYSGWINVVKVFNPPL